MCILTTEEFIDIAQQIAEKNDLNTHAQKPISAVTTSIFISHEQDDYEKMLLAKFFFENLGIPLNIDWSKETTEPITSLRAQKIKNKIICLNDKFILLGTNKAIASNWCNWQLGIADPFKLPTNKMAILPLSDENGNWNGRQLLELYPRIEKQSQNDSEHKFLVYFPDGSTMELKNWLDN